MIIIFHGDNKFITKRKLNEALENYKEKHKSGLNLFSFSHENFTFDKFKDAAETVSMFEEKKCIILKDFFSEDASLEKLIEYFKKKSIKEDKNTIIILKEDIFLNKESDNQKWLFKKPSLVYESKAFDVSAQKKWIEKEVFMKKSEISPLAISKLLLFCRNDLFKLENEIAKLTSYKKNISEKDVSLLVSHNDTESDIFLAVESLAQKNKKKAIDIFYKQIASGKNISYILSMINFQFRNLLKIKELSEKGITQGEIAKKARMHPFVVKKSLAGVKGYSLEDLKNIYTKLLKADLKIKTSQVDSFVILDEFILSV